MVREPEEIENYMNKVENDETHDQTLADLDQLPFRGTLAKFVALGTWLRAIEECNSPETCAPLVAHEGSNHQQPPAMVSGLVPSRNSERRNLILATEEDQPSRRQPKPYLLARVAHRTGYSAPSLVPRP